MPTEFVGQNGATIHQTTPVGVTGCRKSVHARHHKTKGKGKRKK
jgi:hypothetical protein